MKRHPQGWSIIIFCYNEKGSVRTVAEKVQRVLGRLGSGKKEVILVDDGSTDGSAQVIREIARKNRNVRTVFHPSNRGIGQALYSGYFAARYENVCAVPADGQFDIQELLPFPVIEKKTYVSFFRQKQAGYTLFRKFISTVNKWINRVFLGIKLKDVNWVKIYKLKELKTLDLKLRSSLIESEVCAKLALRGNKVIEVPSVYHQRTSGKARGASLKILLKALLETCKLAWVVWTYRIRHRG